MSLCAKDERLKRNLKYTHTNETRRKISESQLHPVMTQITSIRNIINFHGRLNNGKRF